MQYHFSPEQAIAYDLISKLLSNHIKATFMYCSCPGRLLFDLRLAVQMEYIAILK